MSALASAAASPARRRIQHRCPPSCRTPPPALAAVPAARDLTPGRPRTPRTRRPGRSAPRPCPAPPTRRQPLPPAAPRCCRLASAASATLPQATPAPPGPRLPSAPSPAPLFSLRSSTAAPVVLRRQQERGGTGVSGRRHRSESRTACFRVLKLTAEPSSRRAWIPRITSATSEWSVDVASGESACSVSFEISW